MLKISFATPLVPDRFKHAAVLASTAYLPRPLRIPARLQMFTHLQSAKARRADVLLIVHPKAGGTWLRVMLFRLYQMRYQLRSRRVFKSDELYRQNRALPRFLITNGHYSYEGVVEQAYQSRPDALGLETKKVVFLARNPCDIVVSWYLQLTKRTKAFKRELINEQLNAPFRRGELSLIDFVFHEELGLPALISYLNTWAHNISISRQSLLIRYEDLRADGNGTLRRLVDFLDEPATDEEIAEAVSFASFDHLKTLEHSRYFQNSGLRLRDSGDPDTFKVRRGKVGGYRDYFSPDQLHQIDLLVSSRLDPVFGYNTNR